ncbi:uncharacterized protein LOC142357741, partial [Convolutriloba macropyga]|uniref:uncharacterized protein LOC142357741 n=1 Tax=Convolutriloba macropyga TaxID=536237 RepID=UPI003F51BA82
MEAYYQQQSVSPYFAGHYRQQGSGFGPLEAGIGRAAIPIAKKFLWPVAKKIGRELFVQAAPEIVDVVAKKKSPKEALKSTVQKTVKKQVGGSRARIGAPPTPDVQLDKINSSTVNISTSSLSYTHFDYEILTVELKNVNGTQLSVQKVESPEFSVVFSNLTADLGLYFIVSLSIGGNISTVNWRKNCYQGEVSSHAIYVAIPAAFFSPTTAFGMQFNQHQSTQAPAHIPVYPSTFGPYNPMNPTMGVVPFYPTTHPPAGQSTSVSPMGSTTTAPAKLVSLSATPTGVTSTCVTSSVCRVQWIADPSFVNASDEDSYEVFVNDLLFTRTSADRD